MALDKDIYPCCLRQQGLFNVKDDLTMNKKYSMIKSKISGG
ncbi:hypothetical protein [Eubacterium callanderi]|nr:hypothetical protein [Eubacterium callanderi]